MCSAPWYSNTRRRSRRRDTTARYPTKSAVRSMPSTSQNAREEPSASLKRLVTVTGTTKKRPTASPSPPAIAPAHVAREISGSPSSTRAPAEMANALKPIASEAASATTPRITGRRSRRWRRARETSGAVVIAISPSAVEPRAAVAPVAPCADGGAPPTGAADAGLRTATAHVETPRIITPSSTACPPTGASRCAMGAPSGRRVCSVTGGRRVLPLALGGAALEALHATAGVDQLLLARVERVAVGADLHVDPALGRARRELVAARAAHVSLDVLRVDFGLHRPSSV